MLTSEAFVWPSRTRTVFCATRVVALAIVLIPVFASHAEADNANRNLYPIGERESMLANTGITSVSGGAVFYNPANLAGIEQPSVSMSGTTLLSFELSSDEFFIDAEGAKPFAASGFLAIPASLVSTYKVGSWALATSVLVPDVFDVSNRAVLDDGLFRATYLIQNRRQDLWLGASAARSVSPTLTIGLSVFGVQRTSSSTSFRQVLDTEDDFVLIETLQALETSVLGLTVVGGATWRPTDTLAIGLRAQSPLLRLSGSANIYSALSGLGGSETFVREDADYFEPLPIDVGAGISLVPVKGLELVADVNVQLADTYHRFRDDDLMEEPTRLKRTARISVGAQVSASSRVRLLLGAFYNPSAMPKGGTREDFLGATGGISMTSGRTRTGVGVLYSRSRGQLARLGSTDPPADAQTTLIGGLLTFAYFLK